MNVQNITNAMIHQHLHSKVLITLFVLMEKFVELIQFSQLIANQAPTLILLKVVQ